VTIIKFRLLKDILIIKNEEYYLVSKKKITSEFFLPDSETYYNNKFSEAPDIF
jgi:hypothetical protein